MFSFVYPGQGSQFVGMGKDFFENFKQAKQVFEEASDAIHLDMEKLCFESSEEELRLTANTQPALLTTSFAIYKSLEAESDLIKMAANNDSFFSAGHSLGAVSYTHLDVYKRQVLVHDLIYQSRNLLHLYLLFLIIL